MVRMGSTPSESPIIAIMAVAVSSSASGAAAASCRFWRHRRGVDEPFARLRDRVAVIFPQLLFGRREERPGSRRQRRDFVRVERSHQARRDEDHQLGLFRPGALALEQVADDRQPAQNRNRLPVGLRQVVEQAGDGERLPVAQLDVGFGPPGDERGNAEAGRA